MSGILFRSYFALSRTALIGWSILLLIYALFIGLMFPSLSQSASELGAYMSSLPEAMLTSIGLTAEEAVALFAGGIEYRTWLGTEFLPWWPVMLGGYGVLYGAGLIPREVESGRIDLLLAHPVSRTVFLLSKFAAFAAIALVVTIVSVVANLGAALAIGEDVSALYMLQAHLVGFAIVVAVAAYSTLAGVLTFDPGRALAIAGVVTVTLYLVNIFGPAFTALPEVQNVSPFAHYNGLKTLATGEISWSGLAYLVAIALFSLLTALLWFQRRDNLA